MSESPTLTVKQQAAQLVLQRRNVRRSMTEWSRLVGYEPALHHRYIIDKVEAVTRGELDRLMVMVPPGAAKSTYLSKLYTPWHLCRRPGHRILACSYNKDLIVSFGRVCRNLIDQYSKVLGYTLSHDNKASHEWETSNGGSYFCGGVGTGIAGRRADVAFIDDYLGSQEDADSALIRNKQWEWYWNDFIPRLHPKAAVIIIANRRHEDDLIGRLLSKEAGEWHVVKLPMLAETNDPLGRQIGERLWPEWYTERQVRDAQKNSRTWAGLYQQRPAPEEGNYFKRDWLIGYEPQDLPPRTELRIYAAGDFGISEGKGWNRTCFVLGGLDSKGILWVLPDIYWDYMKPEPPDKKIISIMQLCERQEPMVVWAEKGQISKSLKPWMQVYMQEHGNYVYIEEVRPAGDKEVRAQSIRARAAQGMVRVPKFAPWWGDAEHELLTFPGGTFDDFVDAFAYLGMGLNKMIRPLIEVEDVDLDSDDEGRAVIPMSPLTMGGILLAQRMRELEFASAHIDD